MIKSHLFLNAICGVFLLLAGVQSAAQAQLFGNQTIGGSPTQLRGPFGNANPTAPGATARGAQAFGAQGAQTGQPGGQGQAGGIGAGLLDGNERFVRGNRSRQDFVGTGRNDLTGFVGAGQALGVGRVPAATDSFRLEATAAAKVNKPLPKQPAKGMYYPRLVLDLENESPEWIHKLLQWLLQPIFSDELRVRVARMFKYLSLATQRCSKAQSIPNEPQNLIVNVLSFEPGIDKVDNQLTVR